MIGVQAPRFPFGADPDVGRRGPRAARGRVPGRDRRRARPLAAYGCEGWPSLFLWSLGGALTWFHFGEGEYLGTEEAIQDELREIDALRDLPEPLAPLRPTDAPGARVMAPTPEVFPGGSWERPWTPGEDGEELALDYEAGGAYATVEGDGELAIELDGEPARTARRRRPRPLRPRRAPPPRGPRARPPPHPGPAGLVGQLRAGSLAGHAPSTPTSGGTMISKLDFVGDPVHRRRPHAAPSTSRRSACARTTKRRLRVLGRRHLLRDLGTGQNGHGVRAPEKRPPGPPRRRRRRRPRRAGGEGRRVQRRDLRHRRLPHGPLHRPRRQRPDAAPPLRAASRLTAPRARAQAPAASSSRISFGQHEADVLVDGAQLGDVARRRARGRARRGSRPAPRGRWRRR